jgi:surface protein
MNDIFRSTPFNQDIGMWNVGSVISMERMFRGSSVFNQDIGNWDVSNVTAMKEMFYLATNFNQDLSGWCVTNIVSEPILFAAGSALTPSNKPIWGTCP